MVKVFELLDQALPEAIIYLEFSVIRTHQFEICFVKLQLRDQTHLGKEKSCESNYSQRKITFHLGRRQNFKKIMCS